MLVRSWTQKLPPPEAGIVFVLVNLLYDNIEGCSDYLLWVDIFYTVNIPNIIHPPSNPRSDFTSFAGTSG